MKKYFVVLLLFSAILSLWCQSKTQSQLLFGVAYYDEYMPYDRLHQDVKMMQESGINVVRIAESTWSTVEPQDNQFDFHHINRVLDAMHEGGIKVIIGTPTYAIPTWLAKKYPAILVTTPQGQRMYGARQNMDITNENFRFHAERVIRKIMDHVKDHPAIIGYQVDNETKAYQTAGPNVQKQFVKYMQTKFKSLDAVNKAFGLDYWSNRINNWDDFPIVNGTFNASINASLNAEFQKFQRSLVTEYLGWQSKIVKEYAKPSQFVTQNFDLDWRGFSYGIQPEVDHFAAASALDIAGVDIYHNTQDALTGIEISLGGDLARSMKTGANYYVIETQAQGFQQWVPYPGQLRLQAYSHLASGADMLAYWHWHSIHNSAETYWKGLLSHDFEPNSTNREAQSIGQDFKRFGDKLVHLKKSNEVAMLFSNEALSAFNQFSFGWGARETYNDIFRPYYDALYKANIGVDMIDPSSIFQYGTGGFGKYKMIVVPALYAASDDLLRRLNDFTKAGGHVVYSFKSGFSDENVKVRSTKQPGLIQEACGVTYNQFTTPVNVGLKSNPYNVEPKDNMVHTFMELLTPTTANVLAYYQHPQWGSYAAITENKYGKGTATYIGCMTSQAILDKVLNKAAENAKIAKSKLAFPLITKSGLNQSNHKVHYFFNYSDKQQVIKYENNDGRELLSNAPIAKGMEVIMDPWGVKIIEEGTK